MRGIIATCEYEANGSSLKVVKSDIDSNKLRQYLLYWDKIDFPNNNILGISSSPEIKYLENAGVLKRTNYTAFMNGMVNFDKLFLDMQMDAFKKNNINSNGEIWSIAQPTKKLLLPEDDCIKTRTLQVELYNSIPVPTAEVNLEDILNFKEHRYYELEEFRCLMDEMYISIMNSPDKDLSKDTAFIKLKNKIREINDLMGESKFDRFLKTVKVELDYTGLKAILGGIVGHTINSSIGLTILGAVMSGVKISSEISLRPKKLPEELKDYAYLFYQKKELF